MSTVNWSNPYTERKGEWFKGALHIHTNSPAASSPCGKVAPEKMIALYKEGGYDFMTLSDHNTVTRREDPDIILLPGIEWNSESGEHAGVYALEYDTLEPVAGITNQVELLAEMKSKNALTILNHPDWQATPHYRREELEDRSGYDGIEIYNYVIEYLAGEALATGKWDYLLSQGKKVLGFAGEDAHWETGVGNTFNMVRAQARTAASVFNALKSGNFYCSSGVIISDIRREGNTITVETESGQEIQAIGNDGKRLLTTVGPVMEFTPEAMDSPKPAEPVYVRFAVYGPGSQMAWTQPFFL